MTFLMSLKMGTLTHMHWTSTLACRLSIDKIPFIELYCLTIFTFISFCICSELADVENFVDKFGIETLSARDKHGYTPGKKN